MKDLKAVVTIAIILIVAFLAIFALLANKGSSTLTQTSQMEESLDQSLSNLDSTDLDTGTDAQLDQLSSDSSSF